MSFGNMRSFIEILAVSHVKDAEGFSKDVETVAANVRAEKEERHGSIQWANRAAFSTATVVFRMRIIPDLKLDTSYIIVCEGVRYQILSVEDVKGRGMYYEVLAEKIEPTKRC